MTYSRQTSSGWTVHPGEILKYEFLKPLKISGYKLALAIDVPAQRISDITLKKHGISADVAVRLAKFFCTTPEFWMNLQSAYELFAAQKTLKTKITKIRPYGRAA